MAKVLRVILKTVAVGGTAVQIQTSTANPLLRFADALFVATPSGNVGMVYIGPSGTTAANGFPIPPNTRFALTHSVDGGDGHAIDLTKVYVNADGSNDKVIVLFHSDPDAS